MPKPVDLSVTSATTSVRLSPAASPAASLAASGAAERGVAALDAAADNTAAGIILQELALWQRVNAFLAELTAPAADRDRQNGQHDAELIELRDAIAEAKPEDVAPLVEQMARVSAVAAGRRGKQAAPIDIQAPYFAHLRLRPSSPPKAQPRDVLIGRRGLIDRAAGIQIVDWRDAPVSQIYYRYDEGDDYDEVISGSVFQGIIEVRRNITIQNGVLRRIGCPQGSFYCDPSGQWWEADALTLPTLQGGQGLAARAPRPAAPAPKPVAGKAARPALPAASPPASSGESPRAPLAIGPPSFSTRVDKHLPEIAALIDRHQFDLITEPDSGVVVIQGGAGSGKTTVALHRVAYLAFQKPERFRGSKVMIIVPSEALVRYVSGVLPALGVPGVPVQTSAGWMRHHRKRLLPHLPQRQSGETPAVVARLKKHPGMLRVIEQYIADQAASLRQKLVEALAEAPAAAERVLGEWDARAERPLRLRCRGVRHMVSGHLDPGLGVRVDELLRRLSRRAGDVGRDWAELLTDSERLWRGLGPDSPMHNPGLPVTRADIAELVAYCQAQQEEVEELPEDVDPERYQAVDGQPLDEDSPAGQLDLEDDPLLLYLYQQKYGGLLHSSGKGHVSYEHMVVDEVQDLSVIELKVLIGCVNTESDDKKDDKKDDRRKGGHAHAHARPHPQSLTLAGDVAQRLVFDNGFSRWEDLLPLCGLRGVQLQRLRIMYRSTAEVLELAQAVLGPLLTEDSTQNATRHGAPVRAFSFGEVGEAVAFLGEALRSLLLREPTASVALIARHIGTANAFYQGLARADVPSLRRVARHEFMFTAGVDVTDVTQVKGLEFDYVVILDATAAAYPDSTEARHLLHIAITRCAHQLWLLAASPPSPLIPASYFSEEFAPTTA
jgi:DNA helicase-2/ATP-dependent DNA helicase PcrA